MKPSDYRIRIDGETVSVQHRVHRPIWELWLLVPVYLLIIGLNGGFRLLLDCIRDSAWAALSIAILLHVVFFAVMSWSWLIYSTGEFIHCDARELQIARRLLWTHWRRRRFSRDEVGEISLASRGGSKTRHYTVLTFRAGEKQNDILEDISTEDASSILAACKALGYRCVLPEGFRNYDGPMNEDIKRRGWLVNPWREEHDETS